MDFIKCERTAFQELCSPKKNISIVSTFWVLESHSGAYISECPKNFCTDRYMSMTRKSTAGVPLPTFSQVLLLRA